MGIKNVEMGCARCGAVTPHTLRTPNHLLHLLLTVFTAGLWIVVWIFVSIGKPKATCERCKAGVPPVAAAMLVLIAACHGTSPHSKINCQAIFPIVYQRCEYTPEDADSGRCYPHNIDTRTGKNVCIVPSFVEPGTCDEYECTPVGPDAPVLDAGP